MTRLETKIKRAIVEPKTTRQLGLAVNADITTLLACLRALETRCEVTRTENQDWRRARSCRYTWSLTQ